METHDLFVTQEQLERYRQRGYTNADILPKTKEKRNMNLMNYFTLWMGSIHNISNYVAVGGFLALGMKPMHVVLAIILAGVITALVMAFNGRAGSKYGIPFAMHLRSVFGDIGSKLPGALRGVVAAIAWFGVQNYFGSQALLVLIIRFFPAFAGIAPGFNFLGLTAPEFICFALFFIINVLIGLGGGGVLNRFTAILNPLIYLVFGGMMIWGIQQAGFGAIFSYQATEVSSTTTFMGYLIIIAAILSTWAAPAVSVSDFTQNAESTRDQSIGQMLSMLVGYIIFAFAAVAVLNGASVAGINHDGQVLNIVNSWDSNIAVFVASFVLLMTTVSTNATGNIIPAAYQLTALFPSVMNYRRGVLAASLVSFIILPWRFANSAGGFITFLNLIGSLLGPVAGVMMIHFYLIKNQIIDLNALYFAKEDASLSQYSGINTNAYIATFAGLIVSIIGQFIPSLAWLSEIGWIAGFAIAAAVYYVLTLLGKDKFSTRVK
ncbi:allantoin permease [Suicoccus acidiformans]|uniref:Allantoin permease n=1 Tax=Suicoccus acidiformans TaxID=2036206 RepID=A0A347WIZ5_9LACT|nr:cytosine permease [Suicoccus acidiformans]AXY25052.1 allantoin permease [Suicoccus acidiformans]